jgi:hypothetical protein
MARHKFHPRIPSPDTPWTRRGGANIAAEAAAAAGDDPSFHAVTKSFRGACRRFVATVWRWRGDAGTVRPSRRVRIVSGGFIMLLQIVEHTPIAIWALLVGLVAIGIRQTRVRVVGSRRAAVQPAVFVVLSLAGVLGAFGGNALAVAAWAAGTGAAVATGPRLLPRLQATWHAASDTLQIAGSWLPLALILALFFVKYAAGASLAMHPNLASEADFVIACSLAYGLFSGLFAARGLQAWRVRQAARA